MATTVITNRYRPVVAPRLPSAPMEYNAQYQEQFMNILRLYFNQLDNLTGIVLGESGGRFIRFPYGAFSSDQDQTTTANTATLMTLNTTDFANQVSISSSKITVAGTDGHSIVGWNYFVEMQASDYVEIYWSVTNTAVSIQHLAASGTPTKPSTQSVVATLSFVSALST